MKRTRAIRPAAAPRSSERAISPSLQPPLVAGAWSEDRHFNTASIAAGDAASGMIRESCLWTPKPAISTNRAK